MAVPTAKPGASPPRAPAGAGEVHLPDLVRTKVTLPWAAFRKLLAPRPAPPPPPGAAPFPFTVARAEYTVDLLPDHALVRAAFEVVVLAPEGWVDVPLLRASEVALRKATCDGAPVSLARREDPALHDGDGRLVLALRGPGRREVACEAVVALRGEEEDARSFELWCVRAPVTRLTVRGLRRDVIPSCRPGYGLALTEHQDGTLGAVVALPPTDGLTFAWRPRAERVEAQRPCVVAADVATRAAVGERSLLVTARVALQVSGAPAASVELLLPRGFQLHAAQGDAVREARVTASPDGEPRVLVRFAYDVLGEATFVLRGEVPLDPKDDEVAVPAVALEPSPRQRGTLAVEADPRVEVEVASVAGATRVDPSELGRDAGGSGRALLAFRFVRARPEVKLRVARHQDAAVLVATCDHAHYRQLLLGDGKVLVKGNLVVRNTARPYVAFTLPEGAVLWSAFTGGAPVRPAGADRTVLVQLQRAADAPFEVEVAYFVQGPALADRGKLESALPRADLPVTYTSASLFLAEGYRHFNFAGTLKRVEAFARPYVPPAAGPLGGLANVTNVQANALIAQSYLPRPRATRGGGALGSEGQLPIRIPTLERGTEVRLEATLLLADGPRVEWEYKRRRAGGAA